MGATADVAAATGLQPRLGATETQRGLPADPWRRESWRAGRLLVRRSGHRDDDETNRVRDLSRPDQPVYAGLDAVGGAPGALAVSPSGQRRFDGNRPGNR